MRAALLRRPGPARSGPLALEDVADPRPGPGEVLVRVSACALCRTDLQLCEGDLAARRLPVVPGHQVVGTVVDHGAGVERPELGARVGITWLAGSCGTCRFCTTGRENLCETATFTGWDRDGGMAELVTARADVVQSLPSDRAPGPPDRAPGPPDRAPGPSDAELAPLLCAGVIGYRSLVVSGLERGGRLGLFGFGASASLVIQLAVHMDAEVYVCTRSEREQRAAVDLGATWAGGFTEAPPVPLDAAITTAPVGDAISLALAAVDRGGTVAVNAIHLDRVPEMPYEMLWWERQVRSVANVTRRDAEEFLRLAAEVPVVTRHEERPLEDAPAALVDLAEGRVDGSVVLVP